MKPNNQPERRSAIYRFILVSALTLAVVVLCTYYLFNTPAAILQQRLQIFSDADKEHEVLTGKVAIMVRNLQSVTETDKTYFSSTNDIEKGSLLSNLQQNEKVIADGLADIKRDSFQFSLNRKDCLHTIDAFNAILAYRNTINSLEKSLQDKGGDASELLKTRSSLDACNVQLEIYKQMAANKPATEPRALQGGNAAKEAQSAKEAQLTQQLEKSQADLAACQKARTAVVATPIHTGGATDEQKKASFLFDAAEDLYKKAEGTRNLIERRGILSSARLLFERSRSGYPDVDKVNQAINQIDMELKKLVNMG